MISHMYYWRSLSDEQREEVREYRRTHHYPKHSPPHFDFEGPTRYLITAACYEHKPIPGSTSVRMSDCETGVLAACEAVTQSIDAWCILPNHYHVLLETDRIKELRKELGLFHGRSSYEWNGEDAARGRQVWHNCFERRIKSERHYYASLNYVLNNAVHHGYVDKWLDWSWSSAAQYLQEVGIERAKEIWLEYPVLDYGKKWDIY
jgi:putative transposase